MRREYSSSARSRSCFSRSDIFCIHYLILLYLGIIIPADIRDAVVGGRRSGDTIAIASFDISYNGHPERGRAERGYATNLTRFVSLGI